MISKKDGGPGESIGGQVLQKNIKEKLFIITDYLTFAVHLLWVMLQLELEDGLNDRLPLVTFCNCFPFFC
jgi:hypothetical protein